MSNVIQFPKRKKETTSSDDLKNEIQSLFQSSVKSKDTKSSKNDSSSSKPRKASKTKESQIINGSGNIQAGGNISVNFGTNKTVTTNILPPEGTIGGDLTLKSGIQERFRKLAEYRSELRGGSKAATAQAYKIMYNNFKKDFGVSKKGFKEIWLYPASCAQDIIDYLDKKIANTKQGRIEQAAGKNTYVHTRPWLYQLEGDYTHILDFPSSERENILKQWFGVSSRGQLTDNQHWQYVNYLKLKIEVLDED
ncbi:hypothetical protein OPW41_08805 [Vibrio europaeus]|uniref:hypothetical protein n=1 Tax=Vibrio europaeus TaxID=300876 RepID=UPI00233F1630|nr:hypothetical protein [Vibrio europaeus]MDC5755206.1 hypothetical protein [Vibrio europaeus]MDC5775785.1 hypothetical protein [Vibrio europaeus]MDC5794923.1 hypothetical protein [Vibrio europaeus]MDC5799494.1 hypothetical protein [Vibrio europaeus]MDC5817202.1 hypothetical protein [Vibrio europaeus]